jgi:hypothetical protein
MGNGQATLESVKTSSWWAKGIALLTIAACCLTTVLAGNAPNVEELKARLSSASIGDRPHLCLQIAQQQLVLTDNQYAAGESEKARASLADVAAFAELARDYSIRARKHQKQIEISVRTMVRKLGDIKHAVPRDEQPEVQNVIDRLERVRDDLLLAMFPKGKGGK